MQYQKGEFITVPNKHALLGMKGATQSVYLWICAHANESGSCFPKKETIAKEAGISLRSVYDCIEELIQKGVLKKSARRSGEGKRQLSNLYQIVIVRKTSAMQVVHGKHAGGAESSMQEAHGTHAPVAQELNPMNINPIELKNTNLKNTGSSSEPPPSMVEKEQPPAEILEESGDPINAVISQFRLVNEAYAKFYARPLERKAAEALLRLHTMGEIVSALEYVRDHMGEPFAITVNRPVQLEEKWSQLAAKRKKSVVEDTFARTQEELKKPKFGEVLKV